jgi:hypothetical protein
MKTHKHTNYYKQSDLVRSDPLEIETKWLPNGPDERGRLRKLLERLGLLFSILSSSFKDSEALRLTRGCS